VAGSGSVAGSVFVAAPVRDADGDVTAALSLAPALGHAGRDVSDCARIALAAAGRISEAIRAAEVTRGSGSGSLRGSPAPV
jgi:DNA-binding IclR family transcriptional regulator